MNIFLAGLLKRYTVVKSDYCPAVGAKTGWRGKHFMQRVVKGNQTIPLVL
jgi:hypothetical protein